MNSKKMASFIDERGINYSDSYIEEPWTVIESYFKGQHLRRLVRHQIESYNDLVSVQLKKTINMFNPIHIASSNDFDEESGKYALEMIITFSNFHIYRPQIYENNGATKIMFPNEARLRNFTYSSAMTLDMNIQFTRRKGDNLDECEIQYKTIKKVHIGKLPIMLRSCICVLNQYKHINHTVSGECRFDPGGYFIINGSEKTVLAQERAAENKVYCFNTMKKNSKWMYIAEVKSVPDHKIISPKQINIMISNKNNGFGHSIYVQLPRMKQPIPLFVLFRALGVVSDKEICSYILLDCEAKDLEAMLFNLKASIIDANTYLDEEACFNYVVKNAMYTLINVSPEEGIKRKQAFTRDILSKDLLVRIIMNCLKKSKQCLINCLKMVS